jgi:hypothetical protein
MNTLLRQVCILMIGVCLSVPAFAACSDPPGMEGDIVYNTSEGVFQGCSSDDNWYAFHEEVTGGGSTCSNPTGSAGDVFYNTSEDVFQGCTGDGWYAFHDAPP